MGSSSARNQRNRILLVVESTAANNGVMAEEIREVLLQCAIYCGVPAANAAFHAAKEVLNEESQTK